MAITQLLAVGTTATDSGDLVVAAGSPVTVALNDAAGVKVAAGAKVLVLLKDPAGEYFKVGALGTEIPALVIDGPGTYKFRRLAGVSCGVFSG